MEILKDLLPDYWPWLHTAIMALIKVGLILAIGWYLAYFFSKKVRKMLSKHDEILANFVAQVVFIVIIIACIISALAALGVQTASILAVVGTAGLAIALALKDSLSSLASGIVLIVLRPFKKGDVIEVNGISGFVESLNLFNTFVVLSDGRMAILPNKNIATANIINATKLHLRRVDWNCKIEYDDNIKEIREILTSVIHSLNYVDKQKEIFTTFNVLEDSEQASMEVIVYFWAKQEKKVMDLKTKMAKEARKEFEKRGIKIID